MFTSSLYECHLKGRFLLFNFNKNGWFGGISASPGNGRLQIDHNRGESTICQNTAGLNN